MLYLLFVPLWLILQKNSTAIHYSWSQTKISPTINSESSHALTALLTELVIV